MILYTVLALLFSISHGDDINMWLNQTIVDAPFLYDHTMTWLTDDYTYLFGGRGNDGKTNKDLYLLNNKTFSKVTILAGSVPEVYGHTAVRIKNGSIVGLLIAGGKNSDGNPVSDTGIFIPSTDYKSATYYKLNDLPSALFNHTMAAVQDNRTAVICGGLTGRKGSFTASLSVYAIYVTFTSITDISGNWSEVTLEALKDFELISLPRVASRLLFDEEIGNTPAGKVWSFHLVGGITNEQDDIIKDKELKIHKLTINETVTGQKYIGKWERVFYRPNSLPPRAGHHAHAINTNIFLWGGGNADTSVFSIVSTDELAWSSLLPRLFDHPPPLISFASTFDEKNNILYIHGGYAEESGPAAPPVPNLLTYWFHHDECQQRTHCKDCLNSNTNEDTQCLWCSSKARCISAKLTAEQLSDEQIDNKKRNGQCTSSSECNAIYKPAYETCASFLNDKVQCPIGTPDLTKPGAGNTSMCFSYENCSSCNIDPRCGWCDMLFTSPKIVYGCVEGTKDGPFLGTCGDWAFAQKQNNSNEDEGQNDVGFDHSDSYSSSEKPSPKIAVDPIQVECDRVAARISIYNPPENESFFEGSLMEMYWYTLGSDSDVDSYNIYFQYGEEKDARTQLIYENAHSSGYEFIEVPTLGNWTNTNKKDANAFQNKTLLIRFKQFNYMKGEFIELGKKRIFVTSAQANITFPINNQTYSNPQMNITWGGELQYPYHSHGAESITLELHQYITNSTVKEQDEVVEKIQEAQRNRGFYYWSIPRKFLLSNETYHLELFWISKDGRIKLAQSGNFTLKMITIIYTLVQPSINVTSLNVGDNITIEWKTNRDPIYSTIELMKGEDKKRATVARAGLGGFVHLPNATSTHWVVDVDESSKFYFIHIEESFSDIGVDSQFLEINAPNFNPVLKHGTGGPKSQTIDKVEIGAEVTLRWVYSGMKSTFNVTMVGQNILKKNMMKNDDPPAPANKTKDFYIINGNLSSNASSITFSTPDDLEHKSLYAFCIGANDFHKGPITPIVQSNEKSPYEGNIFYQCTTGIRMYAPGSSEIKAPGSFSNGAAIALAVIAVITAATLILFYFIWYRKSRLGGFRQI